MMTSQVVLWTIVAMGAASVVLGCVEWIKGRGHQLALGGAPTLALAASMLLGDGHPVWRYVCLAVVFGLCTYAFVRRRRRIRWRSPTILSAASAILLIVVTEVAVDVVGGIPAGIVIALLCAVAASTALMIGSMVWEVSHAVRNWTPTA
jgi:hypothetical protein